MAKKNNFAFWLVSIIILVIITLLVIKIALPKNENNGTTQVTDQEWIKGNPEATTVLIEYSDFQCPACGIYYSQVKMLAEEFANEIKIVYRHFPLKSIHPNAEIAAYASEAAGLQNKFWEMHDLLFENQAEWSNSNDVENIFINYAQELNLNIDQFKQDLDSKDIEKAVFQDVVSGNQADVQGTPSFFLNGTKINNPRSYDKFRQLVQAQLNNQ